MAPHPGEKAKADREDRDLIQWHLDQARRIASRSVERMARVILRGHPGLDEFVMAMGCAIFSQKKNKGDLGLEDRPYFRPLLGLIHDFDDSLGITGDPIRFTADGPKITSW